MIANSLPEGTDSIIEDSSVNADRSNNTPGFGASGASGTKQPATGGFSVEDDVIAAFGGAPSDSAAGTDKTDETTTGPTAAEAKAAFGDAKAKIGETAQGLKGQAGDKAREYALIGKDRASEALHNVAKLFDDAAATVDDKIGAQYGDYARQASGLVKNFAAGIDEKDVDELFEQGRELIRKSPGITIGIAAALGFALTRIVKAGIDPAGIDPADKPAAGSAGGAGA